MLVTQCHPKSTAASSPTPHLHPQNADPLPSSLHHLLPNWPSTRPPTSTASNSTAIQCRPRSPNPPPSRCLVTTPCDPTTPTPPTTFLKPENVATPHLTASPLIPRRLLPKSPHPPHHALDPTTSPRSGLRNECGRNRLVVGNRVSRRSLENAVRVRNTECTSSTTPTTEDTEAMP